MISRRFIQFYLLRWTTALLLILCGVALSGCSPKPSAKPTAGKIKVVATTSIIGDWVHQIAADNVDLTTLIGPDGDPHEYQPVPSDSIKLADANIIFENGLGLEPWLDKLCSSAGSKASRVLVTRGIIPRTAQDARDSQFDKSGLAEIDPHAWQNVDDAIVMTQNIRDALIAADPAHRAGYLSRAATYDARLIHLNAYIIARIKSIPPARRKLITSHDAFGYFGQRYGLDVSRTALESMTTEASDPSAGVIADVIEKIKASGVPVIFLENIQNPRLINRIAADAHVEVGPPLYSDALGPPGSAGDTYLKMMRYNADTLAQALRQ